MRATEALLLLFCIFGASGELPKITDSDGNLLIKISDIPIGSCVNDSYSGLAFMNGTLEECDRWKLNATDPEYEEYKCRVLRVHGSVKNGKCICAEKWMDAPHTYNGTIAVGKNQIECICPLPWGGRYCERLACWRKTIPTQQRRYRNDGDHCICGNHYSGENCDVIKSCMNNGQLENGKCNCGDEWKGEVCEKRVSNGNATTPTNGKL